MISPDDEEFLRRWLKAIVADKGFNKKYLEFMEASPEHEAPLGSNRRILEDFISGYDDRQRTIANYSLLLYHHTAGGVRANFNAWFSRWTLGITLLAAGLIAVSDNPVLTGIAAIIGGTIIIFGPLGYWHWRERQPS